MRSSTESPVLLTDDDLVVRVRALARAEHRATAALIAALAEFERRQLYLSQGCSSLFTYCTEVLHFSEHAAYTRMEVARTVLRFPVVLERLEDGSVTLTTIRRLASSHRQFADVGALPDPVHRLARDARQVAARAGLCARQRSWMLAAVAAPPFANGTTCHAGIWPAHRPRDRAGLCFIVDRIASAAARGRRPRRDPRVMRWR